MADTDWHMTKRRRATKQQKANEPTSGRLVDCPASPLLGLRYPLLAAAIAALLFAVYFYPYAEGAAMEAAVRRYLAAYAKMVGMIVSAFDRQTFVEGALIRGPSFSMRIVRTCDAMEVNILLVAAIAAFPMPIVRRLLAVLASVLAIILVNTGRLCVLYWLGAHAPTWFDPTHQTLAPLFMVACALAIFVIATQSAQRGSLKQSPRAESESACK